MDQSVGKLEALKDTILDSCVWFWGTDGIQKLPQTIYYS